MRKKALLVSIVTVCAFVVVLATPLAGLSAEKKVYELKFAWNDIWDPKYK